MNINEFSVAQESLIDGKITLYHGATELYKTLEPTALDFGNAFTKPGWSLFCWKTYEEACGWAVWKSLWRYLRGLREAGKIAPDVKLSQYITWDPEKSRIKMTQSGFNFIKSTMSTNPIKNNIYGYVYTFRSDRKYVSIGNDASHKEYTTRESHIKPDRIDKIPINEETIQKHALLLSENDYNKSNTREDWDWFNRGLTSLLLTRDFTYNSIVNSGNIDKIRKDMENGRLKPGDDLNEYMYRRNISIAHLSPIQRIKLQTFGLQKGRPY